MTPLLIEMLLHYHYSGVDYREGDFQAPSVREGIDWLRDEARMIENDDESRRRTYKLSERGEIYVKALMTVPLPVQVWAMPTTSPDYNVILK